MIQTVSDGVSDHEQILIAAVLRAKNVRTVTLAQTLALFGLDFWAMYFLHWNDTIMHAESRTFTLSMSILRQRA